MTGGRFAVIGNPIAHSLSPEIHLAFGKQTHIELSYDKLHAENDQFALVARQFFGDGGAGMNVTAPFKGDAFRFVDERDAAAELSGSVNTIQLKGDILLGYNTDGVGFIKDLGRLDWPLDKAKVLILGAGGATCGLLDPLLNAGAQLTVANRTESKAQALRSVWPSLNIAKLSDLSRGWDVVINATAASWQEHQIPISKDVFKDARCYDLAYKKDGLTPFTLQASDQSLACSDGLGMLVEQAASAFHIWHGVRPNATSVIERIRNPKRRFIAGAVCPRCSAHDTIQVEFDLQDHATQKACTACDFIERSDGSVSIAIQ